MVRECHRFLAAGPFKAFGRFAAHESAFMDLPAGHLALIASRA
jgi:hypothetical protein